MSELDELARLLQTKTLEGKLKWRLEGENRITTKQGDSLIEIVDLGAGDTYSLVIRNMNGVMLTMELYRPHHPFYDQINSVFVSVKRSELGVDKAIDDVKQRLMHL